MAADYFADAEAGYKAAGYVIFGVPYDGTCCHRKGARFGPAAIRTESWNFEPFILEYGSSLDTIAINDYGDIDVEPDMAVETMGERVNALTARIVEAGKVPVVLGGEHSVSAFVVAAYPPAVRKRLGIVSVDAHLDYRDGYEGDHHSHACSTRRLSDLVGTENIVALGVRSMSRGEYDAAAEHGLVYHTADAVRAAGIDTILDQVLDDLAARCDALYLTIDIDGIDPAYAPAVGTPEPYGLLPTDVRRICERVAPSCIGFDVVEVAPELDSGNTAALAARLVRSMIACIDRGRSAP